MMASRAMAVRQAVRPDTAPAGVQAAGPREGRLAQLSAALNGPRHAPPPGGAVVQRQLIIGGNDIRDEQLVQQFLTEHHVHFYHSYAELSLQLINDDAVHRYGPDDAVRLAADLGARWNMLDQNEGAPPPAEAQAAIQRKLVEISELFRTALDGAGPIPDDYRTWYRDFILNGLCLGFVKVFEQHPDWMMGLWHALQNWQPPHGAPPGAILADLNHHIEQAMAFDDDREDENFLEAVLLAQEAWNGMNEPGADADRYDDPPPHIEAVRGTPPNHGSESMGDDETWETGAVAAAERWPRVRDYILGQVGNRPGTYHIIIYHEEHEMAVRYVNRGPDDATLIAVETEERGLTRCDSWAQVGVIIGAQLENAVGPFGVDIKEQQPGPRDGGSG